MKARSEKYFEKKKRRIPFTMEMLREAKAHMDSLNVPHNERFAGKEAYHSSLATMVADAFKLYEPFEWPIRYSPHSKWYGRYSF